VLWAKSFVNDIWPFVAFVIVWILLLVVASNAAQALFMLRQRPSMWRVLADWLKWWLPVTHGFVRDRGLADVCELLADGLENGRPAASALQTAILPNINRALAAKLSRWQIMLELGQPLHQAAAEVGLPPLMVALLAPAPFTAGVADALRFLSRYYRDRNERLLILLRALFTPASTLALGWLVLITALVVFGTMVVLDQSLSGGTHHEWVVRP
jgi:type II secretory pathway component PulF